MSESPKIFLDQPDALSNVLSKMQLTAQVYVNAELAGNWAFDTSGTKRIPFHLVAKGQAWLHRSGEKMTMSEGHFVMFPTDAAHIISNSPQLPEPGRVNIEVIPQPESFDTQLICGFFEFKDDAVWPLLNQFPSMLSINLADPTSCSRFRAIVELLVCELTDKQPGMYQVIDQIAALLFVQILRIQMERDNWIGEGLLLALFDKKIGKVLSHIHADLARDWKLEDLAQLAFMSRSAFATRFKELVGMPAMKYLTHWRMQEAVYLLQHTELSTIEIAQQAGYESDAAFRKTFKSVIGKTPGEVKKQGLPVN